jgi:LPS O-antigen subunit length determinant protein (WzzB/FepE family)
LPFTGLDTVGLLGLVGAMFGGGLVLFWAARTRSRRRV